MDGGGEERPIVARSGAVWPLAAAVVAILLLACHGRADAQDAREVLAPGAQQPSDSEKSKSDAGTDVQCPQLDAAVGSLVDVEARNAYYRFVTLAECIRVQKTGAVKSLMIQPRPADTVDQSKKKPNKAAKLTLPITSVDRVWRGRDLIFVGKKAQPAQTEEEKYLARAEARNAKPWPRLTWEEYQEAVSKQRELIKKIGASFANMALYETEEFLFLSNIPPQQVGPYVLSLDAMHALMCKTYGIKLGAPVWKGKCVVVAFLEKSDFVAFEQKFYPQYPLSQGTYGLCHGEGDGDALISCYRGDRVAEFGQMMVHETSHGFIHRYYTRLHMPSWVNEGMAEVIGEKVVPKSTTVKLKEQEAMTKLKQTRSLGGNFFVDGRIEFWQYGAASSMAKFMMAADSAAYVKFIQGIKEGMPWEESLKTHYNVTPQQLVAAYGRSIGIPDLSP